MLMMPGRCRCCYLLLISEEMNTTLLNSYWMLWVRLKGATLWPSPTVPCWNCLQGSYFNIYCFRFLVLLGSSLQNVLFPVGNYLIMPSGNLQIANATREDEGPYKCAAYNPVTQEVKTSTSTDRLRIRRESSPPTLTLRQNKKIRDVELCNIYTSLNNFSF